VKATCTATCKANQLVCAVCHCWRELWLYSTNALLALNSHLQAQHEDLNQHYIPLGVFAEGITFQEMTSNGAVNTGPFWSAGSHVPKNYCRQDS
jgi:hypothetical protein